jgi:hypothetical protein
MRVPRTHFCSISRAENVAFRTSAYGELQPGGTRSARNRQELWLSAAFRFEIIGLVDVRAGGWELAIAVGNPVVLVTLYRT